MENLSKIKTVEINISNKSIKELSDEIKISWINPRITDFEYSFNDFCDGRWEVEVLRLEKKMEFEDIVEVCRQDGYQPANIYHLLNFVKEVENHAEYKSLMAPGSIAMDDFEYPACVVLNKEPENELKLGIGNWRGSKIGGYDILRVKRID